MMKNYKRTELEDVKFLRQISFSGDLMANNYSAINSFLYRNKYFSEIAVEDGWLFERYNKDGVHCYSFPHNINAENSFIMQKLFEIKEESLQDWGSFVLMNVTENEKDIALEYFPDAKIIEARNLSDYIYLTQDLSELKGSKFSRKRNHLRQFYKLHPDCHFEILRKENLEVVRGLENAWIEEKKSSAEDKNLISDFINEQKMIDEALSVFDALKCDAEFGGGIAYAGDVPFSFCLYSKISENITDIHFEKCLLSFAFEGGYAYINNEEAKMIKTKYVNREEDLGIEGLRKAKLSYYPELILSKYVVIVNQNE